MILSHVHYSRALPVCVSEPHCSMYSLYGFNSNQSTEMAPENGSKQLKSCRLKLQAKF